MPATSRPPVAVPFPVAEADAAVPVALAVFDVPDMIAGRSSTWPNVGSATSPLTSHPLSVEVGQGGGLLVGA